ncbi:MAG: tetratricopeptide repeat protein, partial [Bryobacteraceae bacterium]
PSIVHLRQYITATLAVVSALLLGPGFVLAHDGLREQIAAITAQIAHDPQNVDLLARRAELYRATRQWKAALADLDRVHAIDPRMAAADLTRARVLLATGQVSASVDVASRLLARHPRHVDALLVRARANGKLHRPRAAIADFTSALETHPSPDVFIERARLNATVKPAGRVEALSGLDDAIARLGPLVTLELEAIDIEITLERFDAALARLDRVSRQAARQESWLVRRGAILERAGRFDEALASYRAAMRAATIEPRVRQSRASAALLVQLQADILRLEKTLPSPTAPRD